MYLSCINAAESVSLLLVYCFYLDSHRCRRNRLNHNCRHFLSLKKRKTEWIFKTHFLESPTQFLLSLLFKNCIALSNVFNTHIATALNSIKEKVPLSALSHQKHFIFFLPHYQFESLSLDGTLIKKPAWVVEVKLQVLLNVNLTRQLLLILRLLGLLSHILCFCGCIHVQRSGRGRVLGTRCRSCVRCVRRLYRQVGEV